MATEKLYMEDSYLREFSSKVKEVREDSVLLDATAFYPGGGGLEHDTGVLTWRDCTLKVKAVRKEDEEILHVIEGGELPPVGADVKGTIDWDRRYRMMRLHTLSHIIASIAFSKYGALVTGGHISPQYAKDDFNLEDKSVLTEIIGEAAQVASKGLPVKVYWMDREEALKIPGIVKLAEREPPLGERWRIVEIEGIDIQADGGPHVRNTSEVGEVSVIKVENRGKGKKRVYYTVK